MKTVSQKRIIEIGITGILAHRLAKHIVSKNIKTNSRFFDRMFKHEATQFMNTVMVDMRRIGFTPEQISRICRFVMPRAEDEVAVFETRGEFTTYGADQMALDDVIGHYVEQLA